MCWFRQPMTPEAGEHGSLGISDGTSVPGRHPERSAAGTGADHAADPPAVGGEDPTGAPHFQPGMLPPAEEGRLGDTYRRQAGVHPKMRRDPQAPRVCNSLTVAHQQVRQGSEPFQTLKYQRSLPVRQKTRPVGHVQGPFVPQFLHDGSRLAVPHHHSRPAQVTVPTHCKVDPGHPPPAGGQRTQLNPIRQLRLKCAGVRSGW